MSKQVAEHDTAGLRESLQYGLRFLAVLLIPSAVFLAVASEGLVAVAFQRGAFDSARTVETAKVVVAYAAGLFSVGAFTFIQRLFYALNLHLIPFYVASVVAVADIALMLCLKETSLTTAGIALANSISFTIGVIVLFVIARIKLGPFGGRRLVRTTLKAFAAVVPAGTTILASRSLLLGSWWKGGSSFLSFLLLLGETVLFSGIVVGIYKLTRVEMFSGSLLFWRKSDE